VESSILNSETPIWPQLKNFFIHLRLKFNLLLVPLFLFGVFVSKGSFGGYQFWLEFFCLHVCLYGGANSLNSYYDRDDGPIGGLEKPPIISESVLYLSWTIQFLGLWVIYQFGRPLLTLWYIAGIIMSVLYSHPLIRLKGSAVGSVLTVSILQGLGAYTAGWISSGVSLWDIITLKGILGGLGIAFMTAATYPLTQVYQFEEDKKHGDRTLSIALGIQGTFQFSIIFIYLSGICLTWMIGQFISVWQSIVLGLYHVWFAYRVNLWGNRFDLKNVRYNFRYIHTLGALNSFLFFLFVMGHICGILPSY